jgi:hypothetical protein
MEQRLLEVLTNNGVKDETIQILIEDEVIERILTYFFRGFIFPPKPKLFLSGQTRRFKTCLKYGKVQNKVWYFSIFSFFLLPDGYLSVLSRACIFTLRTNALLIRLYCRLHLV